MATNRSSNNFGGNPLMGITEVYDITPSATALPEGACRAVILSANDVVTVELLKLPGVQIAIPMRYGENPYQCTKIISVAGAATVQAGY